MKMTLSALKRFRVIEIAFALSTLLVFLGWLWAYFTLRSATTPLIIHFLPRGIDHIGGTGDLAVIGVFGFLTIVLNFLLARELEKKDWVWGKIVAGATLLVAFLIFLVFLVTMNAN